MTYERFKKDQVVENIDEGQFISVPGNILFREDYLNRWLDEMSNETSLNTNPGLLLKKYPWWFEENNGTMVLDKDFKEFKKKEGQVVVKNGKKKTRNVNRSYKEEMLKTIAFFSAIPPENFDQIKGMHFSSPDGIATQHTVLTTKTRLIVGHSGSASIFETGITLHPYYGFPVIPGSAIKGVTRHFCEEFKTGEINPTTFLKIFGGKDQEGKNTEGEIVFYDAWPEEWPSRSGKRLPILELDIINPHYREYYRERNPKLPADNQDPNPIKFLVVRKGIKFRFAVRSSAKNKNDTLPTLALTLMKEALTTVGIGAKTGSSYGYFR